MAQPDVQRVTDNLKGITEECEKIANIPAVDAGRNLLRIMTEMRNEIRGLAQQMTDNNTNMRNDIAALRTDVNTVWADVNTMRADMVTLRTDITNHLHANNANASARLVNSTITDVNAHLEPLRDSHNQPLANFPESFSAIQNMSGIEITNALLQYSLPVTGNVSEKKKRLGRFTGMLAISLE